MTPVGRTRLLVTLALAGLAAGGVVLGGLHLVARQRAALFDRFTEGRHGGFASGDVVRDLDNLRDDLQFAARLVATSRGERDVEAELRALLGAVAQYRLAAVYDVSGTRVLQAIDPRVPVDFSMEAVEEAMRQTATRAAHAPASAIEASPPIEAHPQLRVFAVPVSRAGATALALSVLVDTAPFLQAHDRAVFEQLGVGAVVVAFALVVAAIFLVRASRRALIVRERLRHAEALAQVNEKLLHAEKLATVGILAAGIAHEIGTPLGVIRGRAEYVLEKYGDAHAGAQDLAVVLDQADLVTRTIRQLLDFSRAQVTASRAVPVPSVAHRVAELLRFETERRKLTLTVSIPDDLPLVGADPDQLQQVLVNLLMNACDACREGGHVRLVAASEPLSRNAAATVRIEVVDDGCGIPEESRHQVFDPFFTTKKRGHGTGLGLTIAAQIVRNHGGQIELSSEVERGTRVSVRWPVRADARGEDHDLVC